MIFVERQHDTDAHAALNRRGRSGLTEREHAMWHFADEPPELDQLPSKPVKAPNFAAYKRQPVKDALTRLFGPKCAYCEFPYGGGAPMEVEHYRPKGGYLDDRGVLRSPGYYWLAADWDNLLPSCVDCNRARKQVYRARDGTLVKGKSGKANHFPILAGTARAAAPAGVAAERALLLNPCRDRRPELHLRFLANGFVEPAATAEEQALPMGKATIEVCGLSREGLVGERRGRAVLIKAAMQALLVADTNLRLYSGHPAMGPAVAAAEAALALFEAADAPFRGLTIAMLEAFARVRVAARDYAAAFVSWQAAHTEVSRGILVQRLAAIHSLRRDAAHDLQLVAELLALAGVPDGPPQTA